MRNSSRGGWPIEFAPDAADDERNGGPAVTRQDPPERTKRGPSEWDHPRSYLVPRNTEFLLPAEFEYCGDAKHGVVRVYQAPFAISRDLWRPSVQKAMVGVVLVTGVAAILSPRSRHTGWCLGIFEQPSLSPRKPRVIVLPSDAILNVFPRQSRQGEARCRPVARTNSLGDIESDVSGALGRWRPLRDCWVAVPDVLA